MTPEQRKENAAIYRRRWKQKHPDRHQASRQYFRALRRGAFVEKVDITAIYARDKGICGVCGKTVSRKEASIDHIQPISAGGVHAAHNIRITHLLCNISRGNRGAAQLRMALT